MSITYPSEVIPEIDWENPLTKNLKALLYCDGVNVIDLVSGVVSETVPTSTGTDVYGTYWSGMVDFDLRKTLVDQSTDNSGYWYLMFGDFYTSNTGSLPAHARWTRDGNLGADNVDFTFDGAYTSRAGRIVGNYASKNLENTVYMGQELEYHAYALYVNITRSGRSYISANHILDGSLGTPASNAQSANSAEKYLFRVGGVKNYILPIYSHEEGIEDSIIAIQADPFALFKTRQDVFEEYYLKNPLVPHPSDFDPYVGFGEVIAQAGEDFTVEITYKRDATSYSYIANGDTTENFISYQNGIRIKLGGADASTTGAVGAELDTWYHLKLRRIGTNLVGWLDGVEVYNEMGSTTQVTFNKMAYAEEYASTTSLKNFKFYHHIDIAQCRHWEFNQRSGTQVIDHYNGSIATLVNFPEDTCWQPIVPVDTYTVGVGKDYQNVSAWYSDKNNGSYHYSVIMYDMEPNGFTTALQNMALGFTLKSAKGLEPKNNVAQVGFEEELHCSVDSYVNIENVGVRTLTLTGKSDNYVQGCIIDASSTTSDAVMCARSEGASHFQNIYVKCDPANIAQDGIFGADSNDLTKTVVSDSIIDGAGRFGVIYGISTNVVFINTRLTDNFSGIANHCVTTKDSLSGVNNITDAPLTWFTPTGMLTEVAQLALKGKGWNGTDIAKGFYLTAAPTVAGLDFNSMSVACLLDSVLADLSHDSVYSTAYSKTVIPNYTVNMQSSSQYQTVRASSYTQKAAVSISHTISSIELVTVGVMINGFTLVQYEEHFVLFNTAKTAVAVNQLSGRLVGQASYAKLRCATNVSYSSAETSAYLSFEAVNPYVHSDNFSVELSSYADINEVTVNVRMDSIFIQTFIFSKMESNSVKFSVDEKAYSFTVDNDDNLYTLN